MAEIAGMVNQRGDNITARRMISGLVLKYLNGECFVIRRGYETALHSSSSFCLTVPLSGRNNLKYHNFSKEFLRDMSNFETSSSICLSVMMNGGASNT